MEEREEEGRGQREYLDGTGLGKRAYNKSSKIVLSFFGSKSHQTFYSTNDETFMFIKAHSP